MIKYEYEGNYYTIKQLSEMCSVEEATLRYRIKAGYTVKQAMSDIPIKNSIKRFVDGSDWHDWLDQTTTTVYNSYFDWCKKNKMVAETKILFMKQLFLLIPWLKSVPMKDKNGCGARYIRLDKTNESYV